MEPIKCKCGSVPTVFTPRNGGVGIRCDNCQRQYTHPDFTQRQIIGVWNHANSHSDGDS